MSLIGPLEVRRSRQVERYQTVANPTRMRFLARITGNEEVRLTGTEAIKFSAPMTEEPTFTWGMEVRQGQGLGNPPSPEPDSHEGTLIATIWDDSTSWPEIAGFDLTSGDLKWTVDVGIVEHGVTGINDSQLNWAVMRIIGQHAGLVFVSIEFDYNNWSRWAKFLFALNHRGELIWKHGGDVNEGQPLRSSGQSFVESGGIIYVSHQTPPGISAYEATSGNIIWESGVSSGGAMMSITAGRLNAPTMGFTGARLRQLDLANGALVFDQQFPNSNIYNLNEHNGLLIVGSTVNDSLAAYDRSTMNQVWAMERYRASSAILSPEENAIYVASSEHNAWSDGFVAKLNVGDGSIIWHTNPGSPSRLVAFDESGLTYASDGRVHRRSSSGALIWSTVNNPYVMYGVPQHHRIGSYEVTDTLYFGTSSADRHILAVSNGNHNILVDNDVLYASEGKYFTEPTVAVAHERVPAPAAPVPRFRVTPMVLNWLRDNHGHYVGAEVGFKVSGPSDLDAIMHLTFEAMATRLTPGVVDRG